MEESWKCLGCGAVCLAEAGKRFETCSHCGSRKVVPYNDAPEDAPEDVVYLGDRQEKLTDLS